MLTNYFKDSRIFSISSSAKYFPVTGNTILHLAVQPQSSLLKDLLERPQIKAYLYTKNIYGYTPIDYALWSDNKALIELIVPLEDRKVLKPKTSSINQSLIVNKMYYYLLSQNRDTTFMPKASGHCNGFAFMKLFYSSRGMEDYFFKTLALMASWDGDERVLDTPFLSEEQIAFGYKNLKELFEQWINDAVWFQHNESLSQANISRLQQKEHLAHYQLIGHTKQYDAESIFCTDNEGITSEQLRERIRYFACMPAKSQIIFSGSGHATCVFIDDKKRLHYYDPNFDLQSAPQTDSDLITQQIIDFKYILLEKFADKIFIEMQVYCPRESKDALNKLEILSEDEIPKSKDEARLFQANSPNQWNPLHLAVVTHSLETFKRLITDNFCDINAVDAFQRTPLEIAVQNNFLEAIQFALQTPEIKRHTDLDKLLNYAYSLSKWEVMDVMLEDPFIFMNIAKLLETTFYNERGYYKCNWDLIEKLATLCINKHDLTQLNQFFSTLLLLEKEYTSARKVEVIKLLLDNGATPFIAISGTTPLKKIVSNQDCVSREEEDIYTLNKEDLKLIDITLSNQNINQVDELGYSAIHYAIQSTHLEIVQQVLTKGGDIQIRTTDGKSIWDILHDLPSSSIYFFSAYDYNKEKICIRNLLISRYKFNLLNQSDINAMRTLLISPLQDTEIKTVFEPLLRQCSPDFLNKQLKHDSVPFLVFFIREKQYNKIEPLLKKGADVNCCFDNGNTLLMHLILSDAKLIPEKYELIRSVLSYQPDLETLKNHDDETVLDIVRRSADEKIIYLFKDYLEPQAGLSL